MINGFITLKILYKDLGMYKHEHMNTSNHILNILYLYINQFLLI